MKFVQNLEFGKVHFSQNTVDSFFLEFQFDSVHWFLTQFEI